MKKKLSPDKIAKIEQELDCSSLDKETTDTIKGLIAGQVFLVSLITKIVESSGHLRSQFIKELAKIIDVNPQKKNSEAPPANTLDENEKLSDSETENDPKNTEEGSLEPEEEQGEKKKDAKSEENASKQKEEGKNPKKQRRKRGNNDYNPIISHLHFHEFLKVGDQCPLCLQGRIYPFREKVIPILIGRSPLAFEEHRLQIFRCNACGETFEPKLPTEIPKTGHSMPSSQAVLTLLHYNIGVPYASISYLQEMFDQNVSESQLWDVIEGAARDLEPIYKMLTAKAANSKLFYTDDTSARILSHYPENKKNREKKGRKKNPEDRVATYSSLIIGNTYDNNEIYLFYHGRKYAGENLAYLLLDRIASLEEPIQMKDASTMNIPGNADIIEAKCNAHAIRKFKDIKKLYPKECSEILRRYKQVSENENIVLKKKLTEIERLDYHKKYSLSLMEAIKTYVEELLKDKLVEPNSSLGGAISYFTSHFEELTAFCRIEGAPFDNNKAERGLKMIIRLRKTSMFYKTERGAKIAGILQSIIYTAKEAGVNVLKYLQTALENPEEVRKNPAAFLPWIYKQNSKESEEKEPLENIQKTA